MNSGENKCQIKAGFLFRHGCDLPPVGPCSSCGKAMCQEHGGSGSGECVGCARKGTDDSQYSHSAYFYHGYYGRYGYYDDGEWGHEYADENDFTEADGMGLGPEGADGFEQDMGGS